MTSYLARMMTQKFQIETRGTWGCPWSPAKRILEISFTDKALGFSQDWHFLNLWSAPLSSRIYFFPKFSWIYRFSDMLNLFMKRNNHKNQFFTILSFCEIYVFFPQFRFSESTHLQTPHYQYRREIRLVSKILETNLDQFLAKNE